MLDFFTVIINIFRLILLWNSYKTGSLVYTHTFFRDTNNIKAKFLFFGLILLCSANDLLTSYLSIELQSLSFYVLAAAKRDSEFSTEAGLKYFFLGAFSSGFLLFGSSLLYGLTGTTNFSDIALLSWLSISTKV